MAPKDPSRDDGGLARLRLLGAVLRWVHSRGPGGIRGGQDGQLPQVWDRRRPPRLPRIRII